MATAGYSKRSRPGSRGGNPTTSLELMSRPTCSTKRRRTSPGVPRAEDTGTKSACFGECATDWPPVRVSGKPTAGSGVKASLLGTTKRSDGKAQVAYNGHPLYLFEGDHNPGDTNGQAITAFGAAWYTVSPAGNQVTTTSPTASSNGY
jgi:hypothetical protein